MKIYLVLQDVHGTNSLHSSFIAAFSTEEKAREWIKLQRNNGNYKRFMFYGDGDLEIEEYELDGDK